MTHADLIKGGELRFEMGATPNVWYRTDESYNCTDPTIKSR